jgi:bacterioferritin B
MSLVRCCSIYAIAAHVCSEALRELSAQFYKQAEEEKEHAAFYSVRHQDRCPREDSCCVRATGALRSRRSRGKAFARTGRAGHIPINALVSMAKAEPDYTADNFLQWFIKEQLEEVASMGQFVRVGQRAGEGDLLRVEEYLARERDSGVTLSEEE